MANSKKFNKKKKKMLALLACRLTRLFLFQDQFLTQMTDPIIDHLLTFLIIFFNLITELLPKIDLI